MSTKFLFPDWENEDDDSQDLCGRMREMAEEAARRERQGLPEKKEREEFLLWLWYFFLKELCNSILHSG